MDFFEDFENKMCNTISGQQGEVSYRIISNPAPLTLRQNSWVEKVTNSRN